ncbi:50S ribosomal protein L17 [Candidatus Margulisiibacteriota bacterium]
MRHRKGNRKLGRATDQRVAMLRGIVLSLLKYGKVKTTHTRAKEARKMAEKVIALAKYNDIPSRKAVFSIVRDKEVVSKLFKEAPAKFEGRPGGFTRMTKIGSRRGDNAPFVLLEIL